MAEFSEHSTIFDEAIADHLAVVQALPRLRPVLEEIATKMAAAIRSGGKILWCGNGGSAADSQHLAAELVGRFRRERRAMPAIALSTDTSILTAIANDYGYEFVFERQVEALCRPGDVLVGISTSGNSANVCAALASANQLGALTVAFTGEAGGKLAEIASVALRIPARDAARIQECHILCGHIICDWIEQSVSGRETSNKPS